MQIKTYDQEQTKPTQISTNGLYKFIGGRTWLGYVEMSTQKSNLVLRLFSSLATPAVKSTAGVANEKTSLGTALPETSPVLYLFYKMKQD